MTNGDHRHAGVISGDIEARPGLVRVKPAHLMGDQTQSGCLQAEVFAGRAGIVLRPAIRLVIVAEVGRRHCQQQHRRVFDPDLIAFGETLQGLLPARWIAEPVPDQIAPRLIAEAGRRPACRFQQRQQMHAADWLVQGQWRAGSSGGR